MHLSNLIHNYFSQSDIFLYDDGGALVPGDVIKDHYLSLLHFINEKGVQRPIGINLEFGYEYFIVILACMRMGVPYVPLRTSWPKSRTQEIVDLVNIETIIDESTYPDVVIKEPTSSFVPKPFKSAASGLSPAYIITTSGTTGTPKAVVISREAIENYYSWLEVYFDRLDSSDRMLMVTDFTFDISHIDVGLLLNKRLHLFFSKFNRNLNIFSLAAEVEKYAVTVINTVPNNLTLLLQDAIVSRANYSSLSHLLLGGARFSTGTYSAVFSKLSNINVYNLYGPTEATVYSHFAKLTGDVEADMIDNNVTIGQPISNMDACLIDTDGKVIDDNGVNGHLYLSGVQVMTCYFENAEQTSEAIVTIDGVRHYKTGDLAYRDASDRFFVVGRLDDTIKRRGFRINLLDIDSYMQRLDKVQDSKTIGIPSELHENLLVSFVISDGYNDGRIFISDLKEILPEHQLPDEVFFLESFPLNNAGKVSAQDLAILYSNK
jgi:D-alanine--poly(phosphoribitol) ligase subunit 1